MRAALRLEDIGRAGSIRFSRLVRMIGEQAAFKTRAWVARVHINTYGYVNRIFLNYNALDYSNANGTGSRGVYKCYWLEEGVYYEVSSPVSWKGVDRYFCEVINGEIIRMTKEEVQDAQARIRY